MTSVKIVGNYWDKKIPTPIVRDINEIVRTTRRTGREASMTICKRPSHGKGREFTGGATVGDKTSTEVMPCHERYGITDRVGDVHTHPVSYDTIGILPSEADMTGYIRDSYYNRSRQIGCVTNHYVPHIVCMQPKTIPDRKKYREYEDALDRNPWPKGVDPYFLDNVARDFNVAFYDRDTGQYVPEPTVKQVMRAAFSKAGRHTRKIVSRMSRTAFCNYIQDLTVPSNDNISEACREELEDKELLGVEYEKYLNELDRYGIHTPSSVEEIHTEVVSRPRACPYKSD